MQQAVMSVHAANLAHPLATAAVPQPQRVNSGVGQAPAASGEGRCEDVFGHDFRQLRVHSGQASRLQRKCACGARSSSGETCDECQGKLQAKLSVGPVDDPLEHEADRIAEQVLASDKPEAARATPVRVQRASGQGAGPVSTVPLSVERTLAGSGRPLEAPVRSDMEQRFGHNFLDVRVHADAEAQGSARDVDALAFTAGRHIVFGAGQYSPGTPEGRRLLAHELAHVLQQRSGDASMRVQRRECTSNRKCADVEGCAQPDGGEKSDGSESTSFTLTVNIDTEADSWEGALRKQKFGHTFVRFSESNGTQYTYGFYPAGELPNENKRGVEGCVNHPDTTHDACTDRAETFVLKKDQYVAALKQAQESCRKRHYYGLNDAGLSYTCTTFAAEVTSAAGKRLPSSASKATEVFYQKVPSIDNPNTLSENMAAELRGMGTDDEVLTAVEIWGESMLKRFHHQEKARWIRMLLDGWVSDRDTDAVVKIGNNTSAADLVKLRAEVDASVQAMNSSSQRKRVRSALGY
jgi:hypothetical protein